MSAPTGPVQDGDRPLARHPERSPRRRRHPGEGDRKTPIPHDRDVQMGHPIENFFHRIKEFRSIAIRYDKTDTSYASTSLPLSSHSNECLQTLMHALP